jgi:hypothetical protein
MQWDLHVHGVCSFASMSFGRFRRGDPISNVTDRSEWLELGLFVWCSPLQSPIGRMVIGINRLGLGSILVSAQVWVAGGAYDRNPLRLASGRMELARAIHAVLWDCVHFHLRPT